MKVAIVGSSEYSRNRAPYHDRRWKIWGLAWHHMNLPRFDLLFEMHSDKTHACTWVDSLADTMRKHRNKLVMQPEAAKLFNCIQYPMHRIRQMQPDHERYGPAESYVSSSIAYMLAYAAMDKQITEVMIAGVDMAEDGEYAHQRPCAEYWIGVLRGQGKKVRIVKQSAVCTQVAQYGFDNNVASEVKQLQYKEFEVYCSQLMENADAKLGEPLNDKTQGYFIGAIEATQLIMEAYRRIERGGFVAGLIEIKEAS